MIQFLRAFPGFALGIFLGLVLAILSEVEVFLLTCLGILIALKTDPIIGGIVVLSVYVIFRMAGYYVSLIAKEIHLVSSVMSRRNSDES